MVVVGAGSMALRGSDLGHTECSEAGWHVVDGADGNACTGSIFPEVVQSLSLPFLVSTVASVLMPSHP